MSSGFDRKKFSTNKISSLFFMSPERILAEVDLNKEFQLAKCDMWSIGVILNFLLFGDLPFLGSNTSKLVKEIKKSKFSVLARDVNAWQPDVISLFDLIQKLMEYDPTRRLDAAQALNHKFMTTNLQKSQ